MISVKTNNSNLKEKIILRLKNLPNKEKIYVLDLFHGDGTIWESIKRITKKNIIVHGIDIKIYEDSFALIGDNLKTLESLNLNKYDIIDVDAYGEPVDLLKIIFSKLENPTQLFITFIQSQFGRLPNKLLLENSIDPNIYTKCQTLFNKHGKELFFYFLSCYFITNILYYQTGSKIYLACIGKGESNEYNL